MESWKAGCKARKPESWLQTSLRKKKKKDEEKKFFDLANNLLAYYIALTQH